MVNKKILFLLLSVFIVSTLSGCNLKENLEQDIIEEKQQEIQQEEQAKKEDYIKNENMVEIGNDCYIKDIGEQRVYGINTPCYNIVLDNIGLTFRVPNYVINKEYNKINNFNEITLASNEDFNKKYVMTDDNSFTFIQPSGYIVLSRKFDLGDSLSQNLSNNQLEDVFSSIFAGSFIAPDTVNYTLEDKGEIKLLKTNCSLYPFGNYETSYSGCCMIYFHNNNAYLLTVAASTFSYQPNIDKNICEYVVMSSNYSY